MGTGITFGISSSIPITSMQTERSSSTSSATHFQPPSDEYSFQTKATSASKTQNTPIPSEVLIAPAEVNGVHYSRSIPIQSSVQQSNENSQNDSKSGNFTPENFKNGLPYLAALPTVPLPSQVAPHLFAGQNGPPYQTNIKVPGSDGTSAVAPIINNINNNNYYAPVTTNVQTNTNNGNWYGNGSGGGAGDGNGSGNAKDSSSGLSTGNNNGLGDNGALKDLMNPYKGMMTPEMAASEPELPPMPPQQPAPPQPPQAKKQASTSPPTSLLGSTMDHCVVTDINEKLNSKDPDVRAGAAMEFYKILELKPDLADLDSPYRSLVEAFMTKILRDPNDVVRQPALLAFETGLFHYPNAKMVGIMKELADGEGLHHIEPDIVENILASEKPEEQVLEERKQQKNSPNTVAGNRLNIQEQGQPIDDMVASKLNSDPLAGLASPMHPPGVTPQDLYPGLDNPMAEMPPAENDENNNSMLNPSPGAGLPGQSSGQPDMSQFMTPENLQNALAMMPPELQNDPKMQELMSNPQMLMDMMNADPAMKAQADVMLQTALAGQDSGQESPPMTMPTPSGPPASSAPDISQFMTPENLQNAMAMMPPELQNDPQMQELMSNPQMLMEMMNADPAMKDQANAMLQSSLSDQGAQQSSPQMTMSPPSGPSASSAPDISQFMTPENLQNALAMMPPEMQNDPQMRELMTNPQMMTELLNSDPAMKAQANAMLQSSLGKQSAMMPSGGMPDLANMDLDAMLTPENLQMAMQFMPPELKNDPMMQQVLQNPDMLKQMVKAMPPEEIAMAEKMIQNTPVSLDMLPQDIDEAKQLGYSNVSQGNQAFDGLGAPTIAGNRLDVTSSA